MDRVLCWFEFVFIVDVHICCALKWVELLIESGLWHSRRESGKERVGKREKRREKKGKVVWGKRVSFCFCVTVSFTSSFSPHFNQPCHHSSSYALTHTVHHTMAHNMPHKHTCVILFFCVWLPMHSIHTQSNNTTPRNHAITTRGTTNECWNEWMGIAVVIEDTTPQTPSITMKHWWHSPHLVTLIAWIGHAHSSQHHKGKSDEVSRRKRWLEKEGWHKKKSATFVLVWHHSNHSPLVSKPKKEEQRKRR